MLVLSGLTLTVEDLDDCLDELEEDIRYFVVNNGSKYITNIREKLISIKKNNF
jgi:hypothetical protein